ncbi:MAG: HAD-IA family hydrolase [Nanoarchaeota archaeon]|nr:HAD-IA family hydrolase [Nanoarchaeota archaeon]
MKEESKKRCSKTKSIIFDIGGVLELGEQSRKINGCYHTKGVHEYVASKLGISLDQYFDSIDTVYSESMENKISKQLLLKVLSQNLKKPQKEIEKLFHKAYRKKFKRNKKLYKFAFSLKKKGYKIGILSDQWHLSADVFAPKKPMKKFNAVVISCDVGLRKPHPKIYKLVLKKLKTKPSEAIFIDNQKWNIEPAKKLGIHTILYKNNKQLFKQLSKWGVE